MGVVKDGTISGFLPSTTTTTSGGGEQVFAIHYPGYPSSMSRAIDTLGGTQGIRKTLHSHSNNRLELHFRHDDPYSHPAFGDLRPCHNFLLKISKTKSAGGQNDQVSKTCPQHATNSDSDTELLAAQQVQILTTETHQLNVCADIVAPVPQAYHFDGMVDYQHVISVHADAARKRKRNWVETEEPHFDRGGLMGIDQEDVMILLPPLFAPKDVPDNLVLKPSGTLSVKKNQEEPVQHQLERHKTTCRLLIGDFGLAMDMEPVLAIDFGINEIPKRTNWEEYIPQDSSQWESQMALSRLFDERPVWPKDSVTERLLDKGFNFSDHMLRRLLSRVAYYFSRGPFLRFWIKKGFDPRKVPDSRIYQKIDYRVKPPLQGYCEANSANQRKHKWGDLCAFRVFPYKFHTTLQLFELDDDYIQEQIRKAPAQTTCSSETGWFSYNFLENLKHRVQVRFLSVYPKPGAEHLLKAATESFKKSKKICSKDNLVRDEMVQQQANAELTGDVDSEELNNVEDDEEDDIEVDNGEEALDTYDGHDLAEDGEISLQPHSSILQISNGRELNIDNDAPLFSVEGKCSNCSVLSREFRDKLMPTVQELFKACKLWISYIFLDLNMENISRTHLQELFGSFPSPEAGGDRIQDAYTSDEEYQIYEQDSDGNFSDEN